MRRHVLSISVAGTLALGLMTDPAVARDGRDARGECSGGQSVWRLRVQPEDNRSLRIRFRIDGGEEGHQWQLFVSDNGARVYAGTKVSGDDGRVGIRRSIRDRRGRDRIAATGIDLVTGESCSGAVRQ